jgi:hypothetical protein
VRATLANLVAVAKEKGIRPPAIFVIGQVVAHAEALDAVSSQPLRGARVGIFAPCSTLARSLQQGGAEVLVAPNPWTAAARLVLGSAPLTGWIIRTRDELDALDSERTAHSILGNGVLWCLGVELANLARARGWANAAEVGTAVLNGPTGPAPQHRGSVRGRQRADVHRRPRAGAGPQPPPFARFAPEDCPTGRSSRRLRLPCRGPGGER